jgi:hypothetical protein
MKIFNLSLQRTGTQSFDALVSKKLKCIHYVDADFDFSFKTEEELWQKYKARYIDRGYVAFSDFPIPIFLDRLMEKFPDSKFVFFRRNKEKWIKSVEKHRATLLSENRNVLVDDLFYEKYVGKKFILLTSEDLSKAYDAYYEHIESYRNMILCLDLEDNPKVNSRRIGKHIGVRFDTNYPTIDYNKS